MYVYIYIYTEYIQLYMYKIPQPWLYVQSKREPHQVEGPEPTPGATAIDGYCLVITSMPIRGEGQHY